MMSLLDFQRGKGSRLSTGFRRGDSWREPVGPHAEHSGRVFALGDGCIVDQDSGKVKHGLRVRCSGCHLPWLKERDQ